MNVVTSKYTYDVLASYNDLDDVECVECQPETEDRIGVIFGDTELDGPEHCSICNALIDVRLTHEGMRYVREICDGGSPNPITDLWRETFSYAWD